MLVNVMIVNKKHVHAFFKHSVFQSEARICLSFSQIQPQNMLKICLSKNIQKNRFHEMSNVWEEGVGRRYQNENENRHHEKIHS